MNQHYSTIIIIIALILFSIYRRVRRNIGWQPLALGNLKFRTILFFIIGLIFFAEGVFHPISLISDIAGILLGIILAYYGAAATNFEKRERKIFYRPNTWIGSIVTLIFLARFFYRFYGIFSQGGLAAMKNGQTNGLQNIGYTAGNSWTAGLMLIMFAYYVVYYIFLMRKQKTLLQEETQNETIKDE